MFKPVNRLIHTSTVHLWFKGYSLQNLFLSIKHLIPVKLERCLFAPSEAVSFSSAKLHLRNFTNHFCSIIHFFASICLFSISLLTVVLAKYGKMH